MSVILYQCDTCKRQKEFARNPTGLETVGRCTITHGCRGRLFQTKVLQDHTRVNIPDSVQGLDDWFQRKALHNHTQSIKNQVWTIEHNLGTFPSVNVFVDRPIQGNRSNREEITPTDIVTIDENTTELHFDRDWSGIAQLVARQTDPDMFDTNQTRRAEEQPDVQLTTNGILTIATLVNRFEQSPILTFDVTYTPSSGNSTTITHSFNLQTELNSPWSDTNRIIVKGKTYQIRSINIINQIVGTVSSGTTLQFTDVNDGNTTDSIKPNETLILLSKPPYSNVDKQTQQLIDVTNINQSSNSSLYYDSSNIFAQPQLIQQTFPPIKLL